MVSPLDGILRKLKTLSSKKAKAELEEVLGRKLTKEEEFQLKANGMLRKPLSFKEAKAILEELLGRKLTEEERFQLKVIRRSARLASVTDGRPPPDRDEFPPFVKIDPDEV